MKHYLLWNVCGVVAAVGMAILLHSVAGTGSIQRNAEWKRGARVDARMELAGVRRGG